MENKSLKGIFMAGMVCLVFSCNSEKEKPAETKAEAAATVDTEQIKKEIQAREDEFASVYNSREPKSIGYYADDAISFFQNRPPLIGKEAIVNFLLSGINSKNQISFQTKDVFVCNDGKQVVEIGYFKVVDSTKNLVNSGNYMSLFEKRDGKYVCIRDMSTSDMPN